MNWKSVEHERPPIGKIVEINTPYGVRLGKWNALNSGLGWTLTDCNHALQNTFLGFDQGRQWREVSEPAKSDNDRAVPSDLSDPQNSG